MKPSEPTSPTSAGRTDQDSVSNQILSFADRLRSSRAEQPEERKTIESWVVFRISNRHLALPVTHVLEILRLKELTGVPNAPAPVAGVMNLRGHVLPVVDTHALLGLPSSLASDQSRVLICHLDNRSIGFIVDAVAGLERLQMELVQAVADGQPLAHLSRGSFPNGDKEPILLLEPARLFAGRAGLN